MFTGNVVTQHVTLETWYISTHQSPPSGGDDGVKDGGLPHLPHRQGKRCVADTTIMSPLRMSTLNDGVIAGKSCVHPTLSTIQCGSSGDPVGDVGRHSRHVGR